MTVIDRISFRFGMADEQFARELYADWDRFFRHCVTEILENCFFRYDDKDTYIEIDRLDLDLGNIPQEEFYYLFPLRLREALERSFAHKLNETGVPQITESGINAVTDTMTYRQSVYAREKRFENLLHYLEYGFCLPEWSAQGFNLYEELQHFNDTKHAERVLSLLASKPYIIERLFLQTGVERLSGIMPLAAWLTSAVIGKYEKQRYLSAVLEYSPHAVIRFIHETEDTGSLEDMAGLIENPHVRRIMATETEDRAEIGVPEYWYRLYGWLLEYYPFSGVPMFGDKQHFGLHLNRRLLSFIRKRERQAYLSKAELTVRFLMEVFGADYYLTVLGIIYRNQRLNADGSPATGDSYAWELYHMLLQLSLLGTESILHIDSADDNPDIPTEGNLALNEVRTTFKQHLNDASGVTGWLQNQVFTSWQKREVLHRYMKDFPKETIRLLRDAIVSDESTVILWAEVIGKDEILRLIGQTSPALSGRLNRTIGAIHFAFTENKLFAGGSEEWDMSVTKAILLLIMEKPELESMDTEKAISLFLRYLHYVLTGNKEYRDADREQWERIERRVTNTIALQTAATDTGTDMTSGLTNNVLSLEDSISCQGEGLFDDWIMWLMSPSVSDTEKSQMLRHYARWKPELLWEFVQYSTVDNPGESNIPVRQWTEWLGMEAWMEMIAGVSYSLAETLRRTNEAISRKYGLAEPALSEGLVRFITGYPADRIYYGNASPIVRDYIETLASSAWKDWVPDTTPEQIVKTMETELRVSDTEQAWEETVQPEYLEVPNAGLCLLAIWFPRLLDMLGLLAEGKKDLKDTEARIRAIFILQRLVTDEAREYEEHELAFNRILTGCPFHVPLPKALKLAEKEIQTVESMLAGVKANWEKLKNTSINGFQRSFIERPGRLEQREDKWVLYVEERAYDILLDSLPWSYRQIRLPWLKKKISVIWRDKEEFDFD